MREDIVCFSHLRWNFVYQRPQHLMSRFGAFNRIFYVEEPVFDAADKSYQQVSQVNGTNVHVVIPHLPPGLSGEDIVESQRGLLNSLLDVRRITRPVLWYYSPMALSFSDHVSGIYTIYDCMDELSAFLFAPPALRENELRLMQIADLVFTGGYMLYEAKKHLHNNIFPFPSSIDKAHFHQARTSRPDPEDQQHIPAPRIGFYGVLDERLNVDMLRALAALRPDWQFILIGPTVKIDPGTLPVKPNIHYLGAKQYRDLPQYLAGWDIAMMPFALNESTRFISPTKTPEYLAGGKPVISPSIADVVNPYGDLGLVRIADTPEEFVAAAEELLRQGVAPGWLGRVDGFLAGLSWDKTVHEMIVLIEKGLKENNIISSQKTKRYV
jgi:glycosyltransferase involved in cell wall biosynthesis